MNNMVKGKQGTMVDKVGLAQRLGEMDRSFVPPERFEQPVVEISNKEIESAFEEFIDKHIPDTTHFEFRGDEVIVEVFSIFKPYAGLIDTGDRAMGRSINFSVGKVLAVGPVSDYKVGDIVKLKDFEVATIPNPAYEAWTNNPYSKSNAERVGKEPPRYLDNLQLSYAQRIFRIHPLRMELSSSDRVTFKLNNPHIECRVSNITALFS